MTEPSEYGDSLDNGNTGVEFSSGGTKLEKKLHENQHTHRKVLNFENWCSSKLSKTGHHFSNKATQKLMLSKN